MRVCPTNVIHPAGWSAGLEGVWTPVLNFRIGTSGCQQGCIACGNLCPTAAIRPISVDERRGQGAFADRGPIRIGTAFVDRGRCLPWAMDRPCIVCQENCPVSPKAIFTRDEFRPVVLSGELRVRSIDGNRILFDGPPIQPDRYSSGDYFLSVKRRNDGPPARLTAAAANSVTVTDHPILATAESGDSITLLVRLQLPYVDPQSCIGCGVCEHECPVKGKRAIRITAENESRERHHRLIL
jgi:ferredoxin